MAITPRDRQTDRHNRTFEIEFRRKRAAFPREFLTTILSSETSLVINDYRSMHSTTLSAYRRTVVVAAAAAPQSGARYVCSHATFGNVWCLSFFFTISLALALHLWVLCVCVCACIEFAHSATNLNRNRLDFAILSAFFFPSKNNFKRVFSFHDHQTSLTINVYTATSHAHTHTRTQWDIRIRTPDSLVSIWSIQKERKTQLKMNRKPLGNQIKMGRKKKLSDT